MRIVIPGSGLIGGKLGTLFARAGNEVGFQLCVPTKKKSLKNSGALLVDPLGRIHRAAELIRDVGFDPSALETCAWPVLPSLSRSSSATSHTAESGPKVGTGSSSLVNSHLCEN